MYIKNFINNKTKYIKRIFKDCNIDQLFLGCNFARVPFFISFFCSFASRA